jgi:hypothetical protein
MAKSSSIWLISIPALCMVSSPALAQLGGVPTPPEAPAVSLPKLPENPTSPTDFQAPVNSPGSPVPGASPATAAPEAPAAGAAGGYSGGDLILDQANPSLYSVKRGRSQKVPTFHLVKQGDTLWDLCRYYYDDPWTWPQIWAINKDITNPHWIYPGNKVRLMLSEVVTPTKTGDDPESLRFSGPHSFDQGPIQLRQNAFADPLEVARAGTIMGSREERILLSEGDELYAEGSEKFQLQEGQYYSVYRIRRTLKDASGKAIGHLVEIRGTARVKKLTDKKVAISVITESLNPIERTDRIGPLRRRYARLPVRPAQKDLDGKVIATLREGKFLGTDELVFVGQGRKQGVAVGNRFLVLHQGDGYKRLFLGRDDSNEQFPKEAVAEITILDARDDASVGLVTRAIREVSEGDMVKMKRGY